jgi:hypothetical protein
MTIHASNVTDLSDRDLLSAVKQLVAAERQATARLIAALVELDVRRLYLGEGCSSLFTYCTQVLTCRSTLRTAASRRRARRGVVRESSICSLTARSR